MVVERVPVEQAALPVETVPIAELTPHASNYRQHPADQLVHLVQSIKEHGFYRNVVIARDGTILAGHGVVEAARSMGLDSVPAIRLDLDANDPRALAVLIRDNEIAKLAEPDDAALGMLLATIQADGEPIDTLGIGADELGRLLALVGDEPETLVASAQSEELELRYQIIVECGTEQRQAELLDRFDAEGISCRALMS